MLIIRFRSSKISSDLVGDYAKVGYAHFDALSRDGYALSSWYRNVGEKEGTPLPEIIGIHSHFHPEDRAVMLDFLDKVIKGKVANYVVICVFAEPDGNYTWTRVNVLVRNYLPQDNIIEMLCINFDITQLKETERMLIQAKEKAEESDRLKVCLPCQYEPRDTYTAQCDCRFFEYAARGGQSGRKTAVCHHHRREQQTPATTYFRYSRLVKNRSLELLTLPSRK